MVIILADARVADAHNPKNTGVRMETGTIDTSSAVEAVQDVVDTLANADARTVITWITDWFEKFAPKLLTAALLLIAGLLVVRWLRAFARRLLKRSKLDPTLHNFILSIISVALYITLGIMALSVLSPTAAGSLIALFGVFGLAVSLAVKDSLGNLASGMTVLFSKPFALGDYVKLDDVEGTVTDISLNYTVLSTIDNKLIQIPNSDVSNARITNYSANPTRRLDLTFSIGYHDDYDKARGIILDTIMQHPLTLHEPEPFVRMSAHGDHAIHIASRTWVNNSDYWPLNFDLLEQVKREFDTAGIHIPYPQLDVHLDK